MPGHREGSCDDTAIMACLESSMIGVVLQFGKLLLAVDYVV
jgi:hypothetical protein